MAPKLKKNWRKAKQTMNAGVLSVWNLPARMPTVTRAGQEGLSLSQSARAEA